MRKKVLTLQYIYYIREQHYSTVKPTIKKDKGDNGISLNFEEYGNNNQQLFFAVYNDNKQQNVLFY